MGKKFTEEEQRELRANPYVKSVSESKLCFTAKFKEEFWARYQSGEMNSSILITMGIDPKMLGTRVWSIVQKMKQELTEKGKFTDIRQIGTSKSIENKNEEWMRHELAYLRQEVEYIKKIILLEREARRKCSSRKPAEQNSE